MLCLGIRYFKRGIAIVWGHGCLRFFRASMCELNSASPIFTGKESLLLPTVVLLRCPLVLLPLHLQVTPEFIVQPCLIIANTLRDCRGFTHFKTMWICCSFNGQNVFASLVKSHVGPSAFQCSRWESTWNQMDGKRNRKQGEPVWKWGRGAYWLTSFSLSPAETSRTTDRRESSNELQLPAH